MNDVKKPQISIRLMLIAVSVISVSLLPVATFGWRGISSSIFLAIAGVFAICGRRRAAIATILLFGFLYAMNPERSSGVPEAARRTKCNYNIRQLLIAIHEYEHDHGHLPPPFLVNEDGQKTHSWRVILLPYLGHQELYDQIDLTVPWDDPVNQTFHDQMPKLFSCPTDQYLSRWRTIGNTTNYVAVVGDETVWPVVESYGERIYADIADGSSNTIMILESRAHCVPWMAPNDPAVENFGIGNEVWSAHHGVHAGYADASINLLPSKLFSSDQLSTDEIRSMFQIGDGFPDTSRID